MSSQLNLLGVPDDPADLDLGLVQREVMREIRRLGSITRDEAGAISHEHRERHTRDERCAWCATDGALVVDSLLRRGLVERGVEGSVKAKTAPVVAPADDLPEGF